MGSNRTMFDAIVVGSGATGSWAAKLLTEGGLSVLVLDSGDRMSESGSTSDRCDAGDRGAGAAANRQPCQAQCYAFDAGTRRLFVDDIDEPYETPADRPFAWIRMRVVGGRTVLWHRVALRMSDRQFGAASLDGFEVNWPIRYRDLRPHYDAVERFLRVTGTADNLEEVPDGAFVPVRLPAAGRMFHEAVRKQWPDRTVTALRRAAPWNLQSNGHHRVNGKAGYPPCSAGEALSSADGTGRLTLRTHSRVVRIETDAEGKLARSVVYVDCNTGTIEEAAGKLVVMCASTIETARVMLSSTSRRNPDGIGNRNGMLGSYLTEHTHGVSVTGLRAGRCGETADVYIPNFSNRGDRQYGFIRGYGVQGHIKPRDEKTTQCDLMCLGEVLPRATNRVTLGKRKDKWGITVPHIAFTRSANELEMAADQAIQLERLMAATGFEITCRTGLSVPGCSIHEAGTARMGEDERTSVLNARNQCWSTRNLFVTDGAAFPSVGFQNPTLTMMALTGRACEYVLDEFGRDRRRPFAS